MQFIRKIDRQILWSLLLCFAVRAAIFPFAKDYDGDATVRIVMAMNWLQHPFAIFGTNPITWVWPPLHFYLMGLALTLFDNQFISPRFISLVLGSLTIIPLFRITEMKFDRKVAQYVSILFAFYTLHVRYSTVAASEATFIFVLLMSILFFFKYEANEKLKYLFYSAIFMNLAAMTRHDTPLFVIILAGLLFISKKDLRISKRILTICIFILACSIFTIIWYWVDYRATGDPFNAIKIATLDHKNEILHNIEARGYIKNLIYNFSFWPATILATFTPLVALLALFGFGKSLKAKKPLDMIALFVLPYLAYTYFSTIGGTMAPFARFSMIFCVFLLPFAAFGWRNISERLAGIRKIAFHGIICLSMVVFFLILIAYGREGKDFVQRKFDSVSPLSRLPYWVEGITYWLDHNAKNDEIILIDDYRNEPRGFIFYTSLPKENLIVIRKKDNLLDLIRRYNAKYLIYAQEGLLSSYVKLSIDNSKMNSVQTILDLGFKLRFATLYYGIFEILDTTANSTISEDSNNAPPARSK